jgi:hypothetical protein
MIPVIGSTRAARRWAAALMVMVAYISIAGCVPQLSAENPGLGVDNGTTLPVTITVNGARIDTIAPKTQRSIGPATLPAMPWSVQALSPSGRVLLELQVVAGAVSATTNPDGGISIRGAGNRVDLSCGRLDVYAGPPMLGPMPGPGIPGDCEP